MRELASEDGILEFLMKEENGEEKLAGSMASGGLRRENSVFSTQRTVWLPGKKRRKSLQLWPE